ncbi:MAG: flagellar biosynthesis protein FlhB [Pseudomonadota bacterium]
MAENQDGQERSEEATPKRRREALEKGQAARSRELITVSMLLAAATAFLTIGEGLLAGMRQIMREGFTLSRSDVFDKSAMATTLADTVGAAFTLFAPFFLIMVITALASAVALGGWTFSSKAMAFKWEKLDPIKGLKRVFAWRGVMEMLKGLAKFALIVVVALSILDLQGDQFLGLGREPLESALGHAGKLLAWGLLFLSSVLLIVAAIDVPFQVWDHQRQLKMTKQEVKDEHKQTEGSPETKGRQRQLQMEMSQRRMMEEVPKADVVVTNPTHYAVALRYTSTEMSAPVLVAKGSDLVASRIRGLAAEHEVPILSAPPLARALYFSTDLGEPIPEGLYRAVAQVLAYVYQLKRNPSYRPEDMSPLDDLPIPDDLRRDGNDENNQGNE